MIHIVVFTDLELTILVLLIYLGSRFRTNIAVSSLWVGVPDVSNGDFLFFGKLEELVTLCWSVRYVVIIASFLFESYYQFVGFLYVYNVKSSALQTSKCM